MSKPKVILAFSGGLDTSFCVKYLTEERGMEVHSALVDTGGFSPAELKTIEDKAFSLGVTSHVTLDVVEEYYQDCLKYLVFGNVLKNTTYPLSVSAERVFQATAVAKYAAKLGAKAIAHHAIGIDATRRICVGAENIHEQKRVLSVSRVCRRVVAAPAEPILVVCSGIRRPVVRGRIRLPDAQGDVVGANPRSHDRLEPVIASQRLRGDLHPTAADRPVVAGQSLPQRRARKPGDDFIGHPHFGSCIEERETVRTERVEHDDRGHGFRFPKRAGMQRLETASTDG